MLQSASTSAAEPTVRASAPASSPAAAQRVRERSTRARLAAERTPLTLTAPARRSAGARSAARVGVPGAQAGARARAPRRSAAKAGVACAALASAAPRCAIAAASCSGEPPDRNRPGGRGYSTRCTGLTTLGGSTCGRRAREQRSCRYSVSLRVRSRTCSSAGSDLAASHLGCAVRRCALYSPRDVAVDAGAGRKRPERRHRRGALQACRTRTSRLC